MLFSFCSIDYPSRTTLRTFLIVSPVHLELVSVQWTTGYIPYSRLFSQDLNFAKIFSAHFASQIAFAGILFSRNWRLSDYFFLFYKNCTLINKRNKTNMLSLSGSCVPLKVSLTVIKKVFLFFRVIIEYWENRYMSFLGDLNRTFNLFKWILRGRTKRFI